MNNIHSHVEALAKKILNEIQGPNTTAQASNVSHWAVQAIIYRYFIDHKLRLKELKDA